MLHELSLCAVDPAAVAAGQARLVECPLPPCTDVDPVASPLRALLNPIRTSASSCGGQTQKLGKTTYTPCRSVVPMKPVLQEPESAGPSSNNGSLGSTTAGMRPHLIPSTGQSVPLTKRCASRMFAEVRCTRDFLHPVTSSVGPPSGCHREAMNPANRAICGLLRNCPKARLLPDRIDGAVVEALKITVRSVDGGSSTSSRVRRPDNVGPARIRGIIRPSGRCCIADSVPGREFERAYPLERILSSGHSVWWTSLTKLASCTRAAPWCQSAGRGWPPRAGGVVECCSARARCNGVAAGQVRGERLPIRPFGREGRFRRPTLPLCQGQCGLMNFC
jgi:hypothetical protein